MNIEKQFIENLHSYGLGSVIEQLAEDQLKVIKAVQETGKVGTLVLTLKFKAKGKKQVHVGAEVSSKIPAVPVDIVSMFVDQKGVLFEQDPQNIQVDMDKVSSIIGRKKVSDV